ncbi:hypothetical protein PG991_003516 [Apiospora marii]|uniref:Uncharacterized protein n=1 Tax=Apiospora marii TaxID=335849 RepID=A0ABR1S4Y8_9PEZI
MASEEARLEKARVKARRRQDFLELRSRCRETAPKTLQDLVRFAAENTTGFVAIDFDNWRLSPVDATELGFTYVPPAARLPPQDIYDGGPAKRGKTRDHALSVAKTFLQSRSIRIKGRKRSELQRESPWYKPRAHAEPENVEDAALITLGLFGRNGCRGKPCLVGFGMEFELNTLLANYPRLLDEFSTVIDLQDVARDLYDMQFAPPLRNTLISFGLEYLARKDAKGACCAGNDSVRIALLLAKMVTLPPSYEPRLSTIEFRGRNGKKGPYLWGDNKEFRFRKFWPGSRPMPKELYPYTAVLALKDEYGIGYRDFPIPDAKLLFTYFERYNPNASGVKLKDRHNRRGISQRGYLSFESLDDLNAFVADVDETVFDGRVWSVSSVYDPLVQPARSREEHNQHIRDASMAMKETRQHQKQELRTQYAEALEEDNGDFFNAMFTL